MRHATHVPGGGAVTRMVELCYYYLLLCSYYCGRKAATTGRQKLRTRIHALNVDVVLTLNTSFVTHVLGDGSNERNTNQRDTPH